MVVFTKLEVNSVEFQDTKQMTVNKTMNEFNSTSSFVVEFDNLNGRYDETFTLNEDVEIWADKDVNPATTKIFLGIVEDIKFVSKKQKNLITLSGRDFGAILQDIIVAPRIFEDAEVSSIVNSLMIQNASGTGITLNNVNVTSTTIEKITFNNISLFDALIQLAATAGFYFFVDNNKDLNFLERDSISSGKTFDNTNITIANFKQSDSDVFNKVTVYGDRQLTGVRQEFGPQAGSNYILFDKPHNVTFLGSPDIPIQPGGIDGVNDPQNENVQFLVNFNARSVILTSGTTAGDNLGWTGSNVIVDYQRSSPLISVQTDSVSISTYGQKDKQLIDRNIKSQEEATLKAATILAESKDPKLQGNITVNGVVDVTPGNTAIVNFPFQGIDNQTYMILNAKYTFTKSNNLADEVLKLTMNKKIRDFIDYMRDQEIRLRAIEGSEVDTSITNVELAENTVNVSDSYEIISRSIGSAFYFHLTGHNQLNSSTAVLGDARAGSVVITG